MIEKGIHVHPLTPVFALGAYLVVFSIAAMNYPGGSINYPTASGYSFVHNFLCDAMNANTQAGVANPARGIAIISHLILSFMMITFFYLLPEIFENRNRNTKVIRWFGVLTMIVFAFMFTSYHDQIVTATGILGTIALVPFFIELQRHKNTPLKRLAYFCYLMSVVVFFIFETKIGFYYLPFLQKIAFVIDAWWVIWVSLIVFRKTRTSPSLEPIPVSQ